MTEPPDVAATRPRSRCGRPGHGRPAARRALRARSALALLARVLVGVGAGLALAACGGDAPPPAPLRAAAQWSSECEGVARPAPLGLDAAREAHREAERRHEERLREAARPGSFLRGAEASLRAALVDASRPPCLAEVAETGRLLFEHEFSRIDGLGGGDGARSPRGPFRRVHEGAFGGPETISCPSCHWVGGPNGAGSETDNAFLLGDGDAPSSGDARNAPALVALGVVEALAREMSAELASARRDALAAAARQGRPVEARLVAKGVDFGVLGVGADGSVDANGVAGVDADLVVKPFGWKGTRADIASFSTEALQVHLGIQADPLVEGGASDAAGHGSDPLDPDADGRRREFSRLALAAMAAHLALVELPILEPLVQDRVLAPAATGLLPPTTTSFVDDFARGRDLFHSTGCATCHRPMMVLRDPVLRIDGLPPIDLASTMRRPALRYDEALGGYPVWLFSDLRRHDMGAANEARHEQMGVARRQYVTARLWGVADSGPWLHDGRAPSLDHAVAGHDGEGAAARTAYAALDEKGKGALRVYLMSMRRAPRVTVP